MNARQYYWRLVKMAIENANKRTTFGFSKLVFAFLVLLSGSIPFLAWKGINAIEGTWVSFLAFSVIAPCSVWFFAFCCMCIAAPFQMHLEDEAIHKTEISNGNAKIVECKSQIDKLNADVVLFRSIVSERGAVENERKTEAERKTLASQELAKLIGEGNDLFGKKMPGMPVNEVETAFKQEFEKWKIRVCGCLNEYFKVTDAESCRSIHAVIPESKYIDGVSPLNKLEHTKLKKWIESLVVIAERS